MGWNSYLLFFKANNGVLFSVLLLLLVACGGGLWRLSRKQQKRGDADSFSMPIQEEAPSLFSGGGAEGNVEALEGVCECADPITNQEAPSLPVHKDLASLGGRLKKARQAARDKELPESVRETFDNVFEAAKSAIAEGNWGAARKYLEEALKLSPDDPEVLVRLAAVFYELGDQETSERHYQAVAARYPMAAKAFRKHLSSRV